ncbi:MAG: hypothetical protein H0W66_05895 [Chthoniobacterales bacterium]|nr:hypothetical protein [Chthoniobacterales bacterium]
MDDGKDILDSKDIPAEGADDAQARPPSLPEVPSFTFIPQMPPTRP